MRNIFEDTGETRETNVWDVALASALKDLAYLARITADEHIEYEFRRSPEMGRNNARFAIEDKISSLKEHLYRPVVIDALKEQICAGIEFATQQLEKYDLKKNSGSW